MKCSLCGRRRASRPCPAMRAPICAPCCGTKRRREVSCPEECEYLKKGREQLERRAVELEDLRRVREIDPEFVNGLEIGILSVRDTRFRDLKDREVKEAAENLYKTVQTGEKGLIYEYRSPDPRIQILIDGIRKVIDAYQEGKGTSHKVDSLELKTVLLAILNATKATTRANPDSVAYLDLITQYAREPGRALKPAGLIELP